MTSSSFATPPAAHAATAIAVPITSADAPLREQVDRARRAGAQIVELRVDCIGDVAAVEALLREEHPLPYILTIRAASEGGQWDGDDAERVALYERLALLMPGYVDVEFETWRRSANLRQKIGLIAGAGTTGGPAEDAPGGRPRNALILSQHDWHSTPAPLAPLFDALCEAPGAAAKLVFRAADARDALRVLVELCRCRGRKPLIALCLGEAGLATRVLARKFGALLTFAALRAGAESAPGQPTIAELRETYRWDALSARTDVYGVVGWPVAHSRSPLIHNAGMAALGICGAYVPLPVAPDAAAFDDFLRIVCEHPELGIRGLSVTIPHKQHALRWLEQRGAEISPAARRCGAVNTLTHTERGWSGANTDGTAFVRALRDTLDLSDVRSAAVLGAGGAARAIAAALIDAGVGVTLFNRTSARGADLARELGCAAEAWSRRGETSADLLVNATSAGMWPDAGESPFPADRLHRGMIVAETVYRPRRTRLLESAAGAGCRTIDGEEMFLAQAAEQFTLWHGRPAPAEAFRAALDSCE